MLHLLVDSQREDPWATFCLLTDPDQPVSDTDTRCALIAALRRLEDR